MSFFNRNYELLISRAGDLNTFVSLKKIRFSFDISVDDKKETNTADINIYNLSEKHFGLIDKEDATIVIKVGYDSETSVLFIGNITELEIKREKANIITSLTCKDGWIPLSNLKLSLSFAAGSTTKQILYKIISDLRLSKMNYDGLPNYVYNQGFSFLGLPSKALDKILKRIGYEWTINNNFLIITQKDKPINNSFVKILSPTSGLIDYPKRLKQKKILNLKGEVENAIDGWNIKSLIFPTLQPKYLIKVNHNGIDNLFLIKEIRFVGDTHGDNWFANINAIKQ